MRSPEFPHAKAPSAHELKTGLGAAVFAALMSAACEKIPPGPPTFHSAYERIAAQGTHHTPAEVLNRTLRSPVEGQERASLESSILSFEGAREAGTHIGRFTELARTHYGDQIKDTGVAGAYLNYVIIPVQAAPPQELNGRAVDLSYEVVRTDIYSSNDNTRDDVPVGALISQSTQLHKLNEQVLPRGNGPLLQQQAAVGPNYTTALGLALNQIIAPPERSGEVQADFARQREAATAQHDPNHGEHCGTITSPMMPNSYYCEMRTRRGVRIVIDDVLVQDSPQGTRVSVMYHNPNGTATNVLAIPGI